MNQTQQPKPNSPGPTSLEGKAISSRNAVKHGCCSNETLILKTESQDDFDALERLWLTAYAPANEAEAKLIDDFILADWFHQRSTRTVAEIEARLIDNTPNPLDWCEQDQRTLGRFLRYQTARFNTLNKARKSVESYRKARAAEGIAEQKQIIAKERHATYQRKNAPEPTWDEMMENMKQQAISKGYRQADPVPQP